MPKKPAKARITFYGPSAKKTKRPKVYGSTAVPKKTKRKKAA